MYKDLINQNLMMKKHGFPNNMNILISGYKGFIGSHLFPVLQTDHRVHGIDILDKMSIFDDVFELEVKKADIVYHLAALTSVSQSFKHYEKVFTANVLGTARVAYLCAKYKKKLIYPSSAAIYHSDLSPYAYSKYLAEEIVKGIMHATPVVILRLFNVFGSNMNARSGSIMYNFLHNDKIIVYGDGEQIRDFINIDDVVLIMKQALKSSWNGHIMDVGTGYAYSINYIAGLFAHFKGKKLMYEPPQREIKWSIADIKALKRLYKKPFTTNLEKDIEKLCQN